MSFTRSDPTLERPVEDVEQLVQYFRDGEKSVDALRVGTEHEKLGLYASDLAPVPYEGPRGIGALLRELERRHGFSTMVEGENVLGLASGGTTITLEPGGQLELSGAPLRTIHETCREFHDHITLLNEASASFGILWAGLGVHPLAPFREIPQMPRERHALMRSYLAKTGTMGHVMMHASCGVQANFDFTSEADAALKLRVGLALSPVISALYANSCISSGRPNGFETIRAEVWRNTDPDRCGLLPFVFEERFAQLGAYRAYTEWALDVPMFFIVRGDRHLPVGGRTFRQMLASAGAEERPTLADWQVHLTTLFPEVRMKRIIEVRGADAGPAGLVCALPAVWKGLYYDPITLQAAAKRIGHWTHADVDAVHRDIAREGLSARTPDGPVAEIAREVLELSSQGLARLGAASGALADERPFLDPLREIAERGTSPARAVLEHWSGELEQRVDRLVALARY
jgi:glutamate--cysteine ligase